MRFYAQQGQHFNFIRDVAAVSPIDGVVVPLSYNAPADYIADLREFDKQIVLDPQTYKLPSPNRRTKHFARMIDGVVITPADLASQGRRDSLADAIFPHAIRMEAGILVAPYFHAARVEEDAFNVSLEMADVCRARAAQAGFAGQVYTGLYIDSMEIRTELSRRRFLNRVTGRDIDGCYLLVDRDDSETAPIADAELVNGLIEVATALHDNDIDVIFAYSDMVGLGLSAFADASFATGIRPSLRKIRFSDQTRQLPSEMRQPANRLYSRRLLNQLRATGELAGVVRSNLLDVLTCGCPFCRRLLDAYNPANPGTFDNQLANQHLLAAGALDVREIERQPENQRRQAFMDRLGAAQQAYGQITAARINLERDSGSRHIAAWADAFRRWL